MARRWAELSKRKTYVIEGDTKDFKGPNFHHLEIEDAMSEKFSKVNVILEDLSLPSYKIIKFLRHLVVVKRRHSQISVIVIAHSLKSNNLSSNLINQFTSIVFCHGSRNLSNMKSFFKDHVPQEGESADLIADFMENNSRYSFFFYNLKTGSHYILGHDLKSSSSSKTQNATESIASLRKQVAKFLPQEQNRERALQLFDYLFGMVPISSVGKNYHIQGKGVSSHILDILHFSTSTCDTISPDSNVVKVFTHLRTVANVPDCLIRNPLMLKPEQQEK